MEQTPGAHVVAGDPRAIVAGLERQLRQRRRRSDHGRRWPYTSDDPFGGKTKTLQPYAKIGTWVTSRGTVTLTRTYANGSGSDPGTGTTNAASWAEHGRGGLIWDTGKDDRLGGYSEHGQQDMSFDGWPASSSGNPFPASVGGGLFRMGAARPSVLLSAPCCHFSTGAGRLA